MLLLFSAELYHHPQARDEADPISLYEIIKKIVFENYPPIFLPIADFCMASRLHTPSCRENGRTACNLFSCFLFLAWSIQIRINSHSIRADAAGNRSGGGQLT